MTKCRMCGRTLTETEEKYYGSTCEDCNRVFMKVWDSDEDDCRWWKYRLLCYWKRFVSFIGGSIRGYILLLIVVAIISALVGIAIAKVF